MRKLLIAVLVAGTLPVLADAKSAPTYDLQMQPSASGDFATTISDTLDQIKEETLAGAKKAREYAAGSKFDWSRDAVPVKGTEEQPLPERWCEKTMIKDTGYTAEDKAEGKGFCMGTRDKAVAYAQPVHKVELSSFYVSKHQITLSEYRNCVVTEKICKKPEGRATRAENRFCNWSEEPSDRENHPMNCITANEAETYAASVGGRLLTEAEREFLSTARGQDRVYPWGDATPRCNLAVIADGGAGCGTGFTMPVCKKPDGNVKLEGGEVCDLVGNVWEWTADLYANYQRGFQKDPKITVSDYSRRVIRGGSYDFYDRDGFMRAATRGLLPPDERFDWVGFRVAK